MKKRFKLIISLCLLTLLLVGVFSACKPDENERPDESDTKITVTVDVNIAGIAKKSFKAGKDSEFYSMLAAYLPPSSEGLSVAGWYDDKGIEITAQTRWTSDGTATARWNAIYTTEYYLETASGFELADEFTTIKSASLGSIIAAEQQAIDGYVYDEENSLNVSSAELIAGTVLKLYYKRDAVRITYDKNDPSAAGEMSVQFCEKNSSVTLEQNRFTSSNGYEFCGWNTMANGLGIGYADTATAVFAEDVTLYAQWRITYTEQIYVERFVEGEYVYTPLYEQPKVVGGFLGNSVSMQHIFDLTENPDYFFDYGHPNAKPDIASLQNGDALTAYYSLHRISVVYMDDQSLIEVRIGETFVIRAPADAGVIKYSTSPTGEDGIIFEVGQSVTVDREMLSKGGLTLYPVG